MTGRYRSYIAIFLLAVISLVIIPKEFIHALYDHEDTPHNVCQDHPKGAHIETQHHHCDLLQFQVPPFLAAFVDLDFEPGVTVIDIQLPAESICCSISFNLSRLRGPPSFRG